MMLSEAQIERWSRQILLPGVGGRGQARLLAARVAVSGAGAAVDQTVDLLQRAGVPVAPGIAPEDADVLADLRRHADIAAPALAIAVPLVRGRLAGASGWVHTLLGRPCGACVTEEAAPPSRAPGALAAPAARVLAALVAAEVLRVLLEPAGGGRRQTFDLLAGTFTGAPLAGSGCVACAAQA